MINLQDGRFAARDDVGVQLFDESGTFLKTDQESWISVSAWPWTDRLLNILFSYFDLFLNESFIFLNDFYKLLLIYI